MDVDGQKPLRDWIANVAGHPSFGALIDCLSGAYSAKGEGAVRTLAAGAGMDRGLVPPGLGVRELWENLIELAAPAGRLPALIDAILADSAVAAHHADVRRLANEPPTISAGAVWVGSPYPGLRAYDARWADVFFGRNAEVAELLRRLTERGDRFLAAMGASGSGKSSLMRAGLLPKLGAQGWLVSTARPAERRDPMEALAIAVGRSAPQLDQVAIDHAVGLGVPAAIRDLLLERRPSDAEMLLFIDQFEEAFTQVEEPERERFIAYLVKAAATPRMRVALAMRNDLMAAYQLAEGLPELLERGLSFVKSPSPSAMEEIIRRPAAAAGLRIEEALVADLLQDATNRPGALALLAFTLEELYHRGKDRGELQHADYRSLGGLGGALALRADEAFGQMSTELAAGSADAEAVFERVFRQLARVNHDGTVTRQRVPRATLCPDPASPEALLVDGFLGGKDKRGQDRPRLLVADEEGERGSGGVAGHPPTAVVEVIHERLFTDWPLLAGVIQNYRDDYHILRQIQHDAAEWARRGRLASLLWPHERQVDAEAMRQHLGEDALNDLERSFLVPEWQRLVAKLDDINLPHRDRLAIGDRLAVIGGTRGDPRPGVGLDADGLPDMRAPGYWCRVEPGEVVFPVLGQEWLEKSEKFERLGMTDPERWMSLEESEVVAWAEHQRGKARWVTEPFWIARYPVTWCQYQGFLDDPKGHADMNAPWWKGLKREDPVKTPSHFVLNRPAVDVSWYDALAFCRWLGWKLGCEASQPSLPTEMQWLLAAIEGRAKGTFPWGLRSGFPWGADWDDRHANAKDAGLGATSAVGMYPAGIAACGAFDLAGNVQEWCLNEAEDPDRITHHGDAARVVRGGSWSGSGLVADATSRGGMLPSYRFSDVGFRLVVSSPISHDARASGAARPQQ